MALGTALQNAMSAQRVLLIDWPGDAGWDNWDDLFAPLPFNTWRHNDPLAATCLHHPGTYHRHGTPVMGDTVYDESVASTLQVHGVADAALTRWLQPSNAVLRVSETLRRAATGYRVVALVMRTGRNFNYKDPYLKRSDTKHWVGCYQEVVARLGAGSPIVPFIASGTFDSGFG